MPNPVEGLRKTDCLAVGEEYKATFWLIPHLAAKTFDISAILAQGT